MSNYFNKSVSSASSKREYTLTEVVGIIHLLEEGLSISDISKLTGRTEYGLRYKFKERAILKGKDTCRSLLKYNSMEEIYSKEYGVLYSQEDHRRRIEEFNRLIADRLK